MIEVRIMHVPGSRPRPNDLLSAFAPFNPRVSEDPTRQGPWWNLKQSLTMPIAAETTHILVLSDDMLPTPGVVENVRAVAACNRPGLVSIYSYHNQLRQVKEWQTNWIETYVYAWGCAQLIPVDLIKPFLLFNDQFVRDDWDVDDTRWVLFACWRGSPNYVFAPSLVNHRSDWESLHRPGKKHPETLWLADGPIKINNEVTFVGREQSPKEYLQSRLYRFKDPLSLPA